MLVFMDNAYLFIMDLVGWQIQFYNPVEFEKCGFIQYCS